MSSGSEEGGVGVNGPLQYKWSPLQKDSIIATGGSKRKTTKRKTTKRKSTRRKTTKRKTTKRKTTKRKTTKRINRRDKRMRT